MGSKTPEANGHDSGGHPNGTVETISVAGEPRGFHTSRDGDGIFGEIGGGDDDDDDDELNGEVGPMNTAASHSTNGTEPPKKRKKPKKKKPKKKATAGSTEQQSSPPRVPLNDLFPSGEYPRGELQGYPQVDEITARTTAIELRQIAQQSEEHVTFLRNYRKAAEVHRQTRKWIQESAKPGETLLNIAEGIEDSVRALLGNPGLETGSCIISGMGFPTGLCLNHQVAHYTPNPGQKDVVLQQQDVLTVDFGVHINGWIVDSAFTMAFDPTYDNLLAAVKDATNAGIRTAGVDVRISDVSAAIQEAMESWEVEIRGKTYPVKPVRNLTAHNIKQYHIHGGKSIPFVKNSDQTKMDEGEVFAIETFGSTGKGYVRDDVGVYGYGLHHDGPLNIPAPMSSAKRLHKTIRENFSTIVFNRRYLERLGVERYLAGMNYLVNNGIVEQYGTLCDVKGSYSAQFEHTFLLHETHKEILSRGDDY